MAIYINNKKSGMTYGDALAAGYKHGDLKSMYGYQSRTKDPKTFGVFIAEGNRRGQLFVVLPRDDTTNYCYRQYLVK